MWTGANNYQMFHFKMSFILNMHFPCVLVDLTIFVCRGTKPWPSAWVADAGTVVVIWFLDPEEGDEIVLSAVITTLACWIFLFCLFSTRISKPCWQETDGPSWSKSALQVLLASGDGRAEDTEIRCLRVTFCDNPQCHVIVQHGVQVQLFLKATFRCSGVRNPFQCLD